MERAGVADSSPPSSTRLLGTRHWSDKEAALRFLSFRLSLSLALHARKIFCTTTVRGYRSGYAGVGSPYNTQKRPTNFPKWKKLFASMMVVETPGFFYRFFVFKTSKPHCMNRTRRTASIFYLPHTSAAVGVPLLESERVAKDNGRKIHYLPQYTSLLHCSKL